MKFRTEKLSKFLFHSNKSHDPPPNSQQTSSFYSNNIKIHWKQNKMVWYSKDRKMRKQKGMYKTVVTERKFIAVKFNKHKFLLTFFHFFAFFSSFVPSFTLIYLYQHSFLSRTNSQTQTIFVYEKWMKILSCAKGSAFFLCMSRKGKFLSDTNLWLM